LAAEQAPERARTEALARRATDRLQALQREADRLAADERTLINDVRKLEIERQLKAEALKRVDVDAAKVQAELNSTSARMAELEAARAQQTPELEARLVEVYKLGQGRYLRMILSTGDLRQLGQSARTVAALAKLDRDRIEAHARTLEELKSTHKALEARRTDLAGLRSAGEKAQAAMQRAEQAKNELIRDIDRRRDLNAQLSGELQAAQQKLQAALRDLAAGTPASESAVSLPLKPFRGELDWPVAGTVARRFGRGVNANGMDFAAAEGTNAAAIHEGVVALRATFPDSGIW